jgi:dimethylargininase
MRVALTRAVSPAIDRCELTHLRRQPIDLAAARAQHGAYEDRLRDAGCRVVQLASGNDMPDAVFIEDIALVFDELAVVTRPGAESRRCETPAVVDALRAYRELVFIDSPGTMDGGDVLSIGRRVFVGESSRTNAAAIAQLEATLGPRGYSVHPVRVDGCLHLKSAATLVADVVLLVNRAWVKPDSFGPLTVVDVDPAEPAAANALRIGDRVIYPTAFPGTRRRLEARGIRVDAVDVSELAKAEGAVTCCSLIFDSNART